MNAQRSAAPRPTIGWREWVSLPAIGVPWIKAKVDTGARTSSIHAFDMVRIEGPEGPIVRFEIHPWQKSSRDAIVAELPVLEDRTIRSSNGSIEVRPVIRTAVGVGTHALIVHFTLTRRDEMGFRMLLGRQAIRRRFLIDPAKSFQAGRPPKDVLRANRRRQ